MGTRNKTAVAVRKVGAEGRKVDYTKLTTQQKIDCLDAVLGKGFGAKKQRAKLAELLAKEASNSSKK